MRRIFPTRADCWITALRSGDFTITIRDRYMGRSGIAFTFRWCCTSLGFARDDKGEGGVAERSAVSTFDGRGSRINKRGNMQPFIRGPRPPMILLLLPFSILAGL